MPSAEFYLDRFNHHKSLGLSARRAGNFREAKYQVLKAAEYLLRLAQASEGTLKEQRLRHARELVGTARSMPDSADAEGESGGDPEAGRAEAPAPAEGGAKAKGKGKAGDWIVREKPKVKFSDIAGLEEPKKQIRIKMIYPFAHPEKAKKYGVTKGGGILLYGPPGTGKTLMARAVAAELEATFFVVTPSRILSKWVGEAEKNIANLFAEARESGRSIVFIDEIESLLPSRRDQESNVMQRLVPSILAEMDGFSGKAEDRTILFMGATNEPWALDYAAMRPGRFDEKIYIGLPDLPARRQILEMNLENAPLAAGLDLGAVAAKLEGYSGADIAYLVRKVKEELFEDSVEEGADRPMSLEAFDEALKTLKPSVSRENVERFEEFRRKP
ncbi:MAG: ATP-binding protein [Candidatus Brocadiae bacterium]|nr:ATP-binding protein [Candidatus Brocadiia bacterium]